MEVSNIGFGAMRLPVVGGQDDRIDIPQVTQMVKEAREAGCTYFDTAYRYHKGKSEEALREALVALYPRDSFFLADKMPMWEVRAEEDYERIFSNQLRKCGVTYFDYYLLHALTKGSFAAAEKTGGFAFMKKLKAEGRARHIGFSFHDNGSVLESILSRHPEMEFVQLQINYLDWEGGRANENYEVARKYNKPIIIMEPVKGGALAKLPAGAEKLLRDYCPKRSPASWAIRYAASLPGVLTVLSGMSNLEQLRDNMETFRDFSVLTPVERRILQDALEIYRRNSYIPCTGCKYCDGCPQEVDIPMIFSIYNEYKRSGDSWHAKTHYASINPDKRADRCVSCGYCVERCPQKIEIPQNLRECDAFFSQKSSR